MKPTYIYTAIGLIASAMMVPLLYSVMTKFPVIIGINNQSGLSVTAIYFEEPGYGFSGNMILSSLFNERIGKIPHAGHSCLRNVKIQYETNEIQVLENINGCQNTDTVLSERVFIRGEAKANPSFNVINNAKEEIQEVYVSPINADGWGKNRLSVNQKLKPAQAIAIYLPSGQCNYDARVIFESGKSDIKKNINACQISFMSFQ